MASSSPAEAASPNQDRRPEGCSPVVPFACHIGGSIRGERGRFGGAGGQGTDRTCLAAALGGVLGCYPAGAMFWLKRKQLDGSYLALSAASRAYLPAP